MNDLNRYFQGIADLSQRLEEGSHFEVHLKTFRQLIRDFRSHLYRHSDDPVIHDHLDYLSEFDLTPPKKRLVEHFIPKSARKMYGNYQHREKIRKQVRKIAARVRVIKRRLEE